MINLSMLFGILIVELTLGCGRKIGSKNRNIGGGIQLGSESDGEREGKFELGLTRRFLIM